MPPTTSFSILLLLLSFTLRPLSSTLHHRRVLHQPLLPEDTTPPSPPPAPSPPKYPFTSSTPDNSPFFPSYTSPPAPPSPASFATFPANISSISVPRSSKPNSSSSKLIAAAVAAVIAAIAVVSLAVFLHLRKRSADRAAASSLDESKTQRSDSCSTISFNQTPNIHHIPKLQRPSQTSSEFLYLGTLVNSHAPGGGGSAAFGGSSTGTINYNNASNARKFDSPELRPLPPLNMQLGFRQNSRNTADVVASKDDESEEFYSPKGSINGKGGSIGTGSASRRAFAAIEVENFNGSTSNSSSTYSSSVPGSGSASPVRSRSSSLSLENNLSRVNSMPKSPDLIELPPQTLSPPETRALFLHDSITPSPPSSSSPERYSRRSEESSPRISNISDQNVESHASQTQHNTTVIIPTPPDIQGVVLPKSGSPLPLSSSYPQRYLRGSEESSRRNSNVSDQNGISSPAQHNLTAIPTAPENKALVTPESASSSPERCLMRSVESSPKNSNASDQNVDSPVRISSPAHHNLSDSSSPKIYSGKNEELSRRVFSASDQSSPVQHNTIVNPTPLEMEDLVLSSPERCSRRSEDSSPRDSNVADQEMESPVSNPVQHNTIVNPTPLEMEDLVLSSPERRSGRSEDSSVRDSNVADQEVESPVSNPVQHNTIVNPTPLEMEDLVPLFLEKYNSDASDHDVASPVRISSSEQHKPPSPMSSSLPERLDESDQNVEAPPPLPLMYLPDFEPSVSSPAPPASAILPQPLSIPPPPPPPPPLPLPLSKAWQSPKTPTPPAKGLMEPPTLKNPLKPIAFDSTTLISPIQLPSSNDALIDNSDSNKESPNKETEYSSENVDSNGESPPKPKLKPLHWDKVRASSDREMVWDQLKCSSFELNEEMIETLFVVNTPKPNPNVAARWQVLPPPGQDNDNWVLDPKKAQNIAILLKALHVTADEVCEGLLEGNADNLGTELLEGLLKMAPTKEEEHKLKEYKDDSPVNLGPAERFLKAVVEVPHAFRRIESMLYISNFESEVEYLKQSFSTLEAACEELRTSKMFLKLLEAVLKTGNRMNVGTNRGDAHAFKLDTLLKLVDVKGADGKTTLLHFVVQEIIRSEGARLSGGGSQENSITDDIKCRKLGLQVVSALSSELSNVKKAAVMDAEILSSEVSKLSKGIENVREIVKIIKAASLEESCIHTFSNSMNSFVEKAEEEIFKIQAQENLALSLVKEITEYFHGNSAKEEAHPFRIFMVVRDFLTTLDRVCKDVGMINERTIVSSAHKFPVPVNPMLQQVSGVSHSRQNNLSDDESFPLNA